MQYFAYDSIAVAVVVFLAAVVAANACFTLWRNLKRSRKPVRDVATMLDNDNRRIERQEGRISDLEHSNNLILKAQMQILQHEIHGNHVDQMQETLVEIQEYLINR